MPLPSSSEPALPAAWSGVLDRIQRVLAEALQAAEERACAVEAMLVEDAGKSRGVSEGDLLTWGSCFDEHIAKLATETERILASGQEALERWLARAAQVGQRLAEEAERAV